MVSELSARLLRGQTLFADNSGDTATIISSSSEEESPAVVVSDIEPVQTISACTEKLSQKIMMSKISRQSHRRGTVRFADSNTIGCFKRRKIDVLQFAASRVKHDLEKGGLPFPALDASLRHHLSMDGSNYYNYDSKSSSQMQARGIQRLCSESVSASPFLTIMEGKSCSQQATMNDLENLFSVTYDAYSKPSSNGSGSGGNASDLSSICSLTSETDSSSVNDQNTNFTVPSTTVASFLEAAPSTPAMDTVYASPISIRDAFENTCEPRLVTLSFAPFLVVHANPEYSRMTGHTPADVLGKPLHELIQDQACKAATAKTHTLASLNDQVTNFFTPAASGAATKCRVRVSVVGTDAAAVKKNRSLVTHFMVSLTEERSDNQVESAAATTNTAALQDNDSANATAVNLMRVVPLPSLESTNAVPHQVQNMRLHCGVMG